jgi:hypothetical protein
LSGKVFFTFSDARTSGAQWAEVYKALKSLTDDDILVRRMYKDATSESARLNFVIMSQDSIKIEAGDRRVAFSECDNRYAVGAPGLAFGMDKRQYYKQLGAATEDPTVAQAYAAFLTHWAAQHPDVDLTKIPNSEEREEALEIGLDSGCLFLKEFFLLGHKELARYPSVQLQLDYARWKQNRGFHAPKRGEVSKHLKKAFGWRLQAAAACMGPGGAVQSRYFRETTAELLQAFKDRSWWTVDDQAAITPVDPREAEQMTKQADEKAATLFEAVCESSAATVCQEKLQPPSLAADKHPELRGGGRPPSRVSAKTKTVEAGSIDELFDL